MAARKTWTRSAPIIHDGTTKRRIQQARAIPPRGTQRRPRRLPRAPFVAVALTLFALTSPDLTQAPLLANERVPTLAPRVDSLPTVPRRAAIPAPPAPPAPPVDASAYQAALGAAREYGEAWGATFAIVRDGQIEWSGGAGRERNGLTRLRANAPMVIGSVTKTFVAAAVLQLAEEGRLDLNQRVRRFLPDVSAVPRKVTIRQLLDHTSGLADVFNDTTRRGIEEHPQHAWTTREVLGSLHAPWYAPGEGWAYANTNYYLLGMVVEKVTGRPLADELASRFFGPLGLHDTRLLSPTDPTSPLEPAWTTIFWASGAMTCSAVDLARWGDALYGGDVLRRTTRADMLRFNSDDYGLGAQRLEIGEVSGYGHTGLLNTYTTLLLHLPRADVTIALIVNRADVDLGGMMLARPASGGPSLLELATGTDMPATPVPAAASASGS